MNAVLGHHPWSQGFPGEAAFSMATAGATWKVKFIFCSGLAQACSGDLQREPTEVGEWERVIQPWGCRRWAQHTLLRRLGVQAHQPENS